MSRAREQRGAVRGGVHAAEDVGPDDGVAVALCSERVKTHAEGGDAVAEKGLLGVRLVLFGEDQVVCKGSKGWPPPVETSPELFVGELVDVAG